MKQGGVGLRGPITVQPGGTIPIDIGPNDSSVQISPAGSSTGKSYPVPPGKTANLPVPPVPPGTILVISVGNGLTSRIIYVEVVDTD